MGAGIAQVAASTGHKVTLVDISQQVNWCIHSLIQSWIAFVMSHYIQVLDKSNARISESIKRVAKKKFAEDAEGGEKFIDR